ncbi:unnamed protein product [Cuscuta epithymum]|nr:unnamed protein product [Cuscuta epithymum]
MDIHKVYGDIGEETMGDRKLEVEGVPECPQQNDGGNCGMYVLKIAEFLIMGMDINEIDGDDMTMYREKMTTELILYSKKRTKEMKKKQQVKTERK